MAKFESKDLILTKKLNNVIYELMVKTNSDMVYTDETTTLTETLNHIFELLTNFQGGYKELEQSFNELVEDAPNTFRSFKEVWDYVNVNGDPQSALIKMIESKQATEKGKGLSTHDFDDILYAKLKYGYSKEELDERFSIIIKKHNDDMEKIYSLIPEIEITEKPNIIVSENSTDDVKDYHCWYQIISKDTI